MEAQYKVIQQETVFDGDSIQHTYNVHINNLLFSEEI